MPAGIAMPDRQAIPPGRQRSEVRKGEATETISNLANEHIELLPQDGGDIEGVIFTELTESTPNLDHFPGFDDSDFQVPRLLIQLRRLSSITEHCTSVLWATTRKNRR